MRKPLLFRQKPALVVFEDVHWIDPTPGDSFRHSNFRFDLLARLRLRPTRRVVLWLRSPVHDELW
jgi:hypothetical protein